MKNCDYKKMTTGKYIEDCYSKKQLKKIRKKKCRAAGKLLVRTFYECRRFKNYAN